MDCFYESHTSQIGITIPKPKFVRRTRQKLPFPKLGGDFLTRWINNNKVELRQTYSEFILVDKDNLGRMEWYVHKWQPPLSLFPAAIYLISCIMVIWINDVYVSGHHHSPYFMHPLPLFPASTYVVSCIIVIWILKDVCISVVTNGL